jgi:low temperature requirement protein LtrA
MRGIEVPPRTEDFTADPVELFFDLAFVFAFSQLVGVLIDEPTWAGTGKTALLFSLLWLPWQQLTWSANAVSGNGRAIRTVFLIATAASVPMAAATSTALEDGGTVFALCLALIMVLGFAVQRSGVDRGSDYHRALLAWIPPNLLAITVLLGSAFLDGEARVAGWIAAAAISLAATILAGKGEWIIRSGHMAERHGLILIVALGEVIVAIGLPVVGALEKEADLPGDTLTALLASGLMACLLWWSYFDRPGPALEHKCDAIEGDSDRGRFVRDIYTWGHAPIAAGIILAAAALEEICLHPPTRFRLR